MAKRAFAREPPIDDEPAKERAKTVLLSFEGMNPRADLRSTNRNRNPSVHILMIVENCIEKNFHVPNMKAGSCTYFRVCTNCISKKTVRRFDRPQNDRVKRT